jgi:glycosyltransferase involved in cell wall biosynthesis
MEKLRVLHLTFDMAIGGTEQVIRQLVENTNADKFDVAILCIEDKIGDIGQQLLKQGIRISSLHRRTGFDIQLIKAIRRFIIKNNIDILHCHQYTPFVYGVLATFLKQVKVIFTEHGRFYPDRTSWKRKLVNPILAQMTDHITSISKATKQALIDFEFLPSSKIQVIYNGIVDLSSNHYDVIKVKKELSIPLDEIVLGTISRLDPIKNHSMMLNAFKQINTKYPKTKLLIIGDGSLKEDLESLTAELDIVADVIFTGFRVEPQQYLQCMDIFLLPSFSEGTSMTLLEAMSFSKACVVTDVGGNPEIVVNGKTGIVIANDDQRALTNACVSLLEKSDLRINYGLKGQKRFSEHFKVKTMIESFEKLYLA